jgi:threonine dehydrogenase-like Zn-dependent dehydrogenase
MQALVYTANEQMVYREEADAQPIGPGEARVQIEAVGICGSDMHAYLGHDPRRVPPLNPERLNLSRTGRMPRSGRQRYRQSRTHSGQP